MVSGQLAERDLVHMMLEGFAEYAISHEAGHALVGEFVKIGAPKEIAFILKRGSNGLLYLGDFATKFLFPPDDQIPELPEAVRRCLCYTLAAGFAATQFSGLSLPNEKEGLDADRALLSKLTPEPLESFVRHARAVIGKEQRAYQEVVSECSQKYERLRGENVEEGVQVLLSRQELEAIFNRTMSPVHAPLTPTDDTPEFRTTMSAHEAGHATLGVTLGARIEAVYAVISNRLPNGNFRLCYLTKFGRLERVGLGLKDRILLTAAGAAGEVLLNGCWDNDCVARDRTDMKELGVSNFNYCVEHAIQLLQENASLLNAVRDKIMTSMCGLKNCKLRRNGSHIILVKGSELERLYRALGFCVSSSALDLETAKLNSKP